MLNRLFLPFWQKPAWRDPNKWEKVNKVIGSLKEKVEELRRQVNANVMAFYLACDPFISNYLSCLAAPGADFPDLCSHFLRPLEGREQVAFFPDATLDPMRAGVSDDERISAVLRHRSDALFGDFIQRERIESRGRFFYHDVESGRVTALLTVNFRRSVSQAEWDRVAQTLQSSFDRLVEENAKDIRRRLEKKSRYLLPPFLGMLDLFDPISRNDELQDTPGLMRKLLQQAIPPLDAVGRQWRGTVHRVTSDGNALELIASEGPFPTPSRTIHDLAKGEGVISWVALRKQAIRIKDMANSDFKDVSVKYLEGVRSQLAVPILTRDRLWGTLSLEATDPNVFRRQEVGYLTRVANLAAMAAMQCEFERVCEERDLYLDAIYEAKRTAFPVEPLPSFEELTRTTTNRINFNLSPFEQ